MTAIVILNPYAGRWTALERKDEVVLALNEAGIDYKLFVTEKPGHGTQIAARAVLEGYNLIISAGGDGSISEVVNGIVQANKETNEPITTPLGILPLGSANDFVVNMKLPIDLQSAARVIANGSHRNIDIGEIRFDNNQRYHYFDNNSAIGLEPSITLIQQKITRLRGVLRYLVATLIGVTQNPQWSMNIEWENGTYEGMANLVTVGNNPLTGGLFYMTPHADPFDGLLTFVYGSIRTRLQILRILPKTMKSGAGNYVEEEDIHEIHTHWLRIYCQTPTPLHADGEIQSENVKDIEYSIKPAFLPVLI